MPVAVSVRPIVLCMMVFSDSRCRFLKNCLTIFYFDAIAVGFITMVSTILLRRKVIMERIFLEDEA